MKEQSKQGKWLRLLPEILVTVALFVSQVILGQNNASTKPITKLVKVLSQSATQNQAGLQAVANDLKTIASKDTIPVYVLEGKVVDAATIKKLEDKMIKDRDIYTKDGVRQKHINPFGEQAKNGIYFITTKTAHELEHSEKKQQEVSKISVWTAF